MAQPEESSPQLTGLFGPTFILMIGGFIAYFTVEPALESRRPNIPDRALPPPPMTSGLRAVPTRLWDDPLHSAYADSLRSYSTSKKHGGSEDPKPDKLSDVQRYFATIVNSSVTEKSQRFLCLPLLVPGTPYDGATETRRRSTYAVLSALSSCGYALAVPDRLSYVELTIAVEVPAVREERNVKMVIPVKLFQRTEVQDGSPDPARPHSVLVLWINENQLGSRPLAMIAQILENLFHVASEGADVRQLVEVRIIGPNDSDTLLNMAKDDASWKEVHPEPAGDAKPNVEGAEQPPVPPKAAKPGYFAASFAGTPTLYSARATIATPILDLPHHGPVYGFLTGKPTKSGLTVIRTIGSDGQLVELIARELMLRDAWPLEKSGNRAKQRHVVLVTESDSLYGRALPAIFKARFPNLLTETEKDHGASEVGNNDLLHVFTYLQGLDGKNPGEKKEDAEVDIPEASKSKPTEGDALTNQNLELIPASGKSQYDYLRRLQQQLVEIDAEIRHGGGEGITAIGVVGTDVYDKLLILRALRKSFPRTWFFSTDVDAAFCLPSEYPTARNLLVASHFGLALHPALQRTVPQFRDSYETSVYFSTLLALDDRGAQQSISDRQNPWKLNDELGENLQSKVDLHPLMLEVARSGPYQLTIPKLESTDSSKVHPEGPRTTHWLLQLPNALALLALAGLAVAGMCSLSRGWRETLRFVALGWKRADWTQERTIMRVVCAVLIVAGISLLGLAAVNHSARDGEPFVVLEGISIWTPTLIRYLGLILVVAFISRAVHDIKDRLPRKLRELCHCDAASRGSCSQLLGDICQLDLRRWLRKAVFLAVGCLAFFGMLMFLSERPPAPFRGAASKITQNLVLLFGIPPFALLIAIVLVKLESVRHFVRRLGKQAADWTTAEMATFHADRQPVRDSDLGEVLTVKIIAESTEVAGNLVKYPFIALFALIGSRHPALDKLELPWSLVAIWGLIVAILSWTSHALRRDANKARTQVLERLQSALSMTHHPSFPKQDRDPRINQLRQYIAEIKHEDAGGFRPLMRDPLIQALALATSGGLMLIHQLLPYL